MKGVCGSCRHWEDNEEDHHQVEEINAAMKGQMKLVKVPHHDDAQYVSKPAVELQPTCRCRRTSQQLCVSRGMKKSKAHEYSILLWYKNDGGELARLEIGVVVLKKGRWRQR